MLVALFRLLSLVPLPIMHMLGVLLGWLVVAVSPTFRRHMRANMVRAGYQGHWSRAVGEAGKSLTELPFVWFARQARVERHCQVENFEFVQAMLTRGEPVMFLTPHLGCFELTAQMISLRTRITVMYRKPSKSALQPLVEGGRARANLLLAPATLAGVRILARELKKGFAVGILPDQTPHQGEGIWVNYFGAPAYTMTLPVKLQQMTAATLVLTYAERLPYGKGYRVHFVPFGALPDGTLHEQTQAINEAMERLIARCPAQYFWSYNRYKTPPGVEPPDSPPPSEKK